MIREEIVSAMLGEEPWRIFRTMQLGGDTPLLNRTKDEGAISSESRYGGRNGTGF